MRCHVEDVCRRMLIFSRKVLRTAVSLFIRKFTSGDLTSRHVYRMFREFVDFMATLRYEPCTQFINVSQRALHIYWLFSAMSHAIHKIVSKKSCQSYFISRPSPHHGISKDSDLCASAHRCPHYAYARLIARVNSQFTLQKQYSNK